VKIIHLPYGYFPEVSGGTEVYVHSLAVDLRRVGVESLVVAPGTADAAYIYETIPVRRFALPEAADLRELYGEGSPAATVAFANILDEEQPDLVHFHAFTRGVSLAMAQAVKARGIPLVLTYHTPTVSCQRGTLLRWGKVVCDGRLDRALCAACALHSQGMSQTAARLLSWTPPTLGRALGRAGLRGGPWTALRMSELVGLRHAAFRQLTELADGIVVLCQWVEDVLRRNGVPAAKMTLCRHGLPQTAAAPARPVAHPWRPEDGPLRLVFLGRLDPTKGVDLLLAAMKRLPNAPLALDIYGLSQGAGGDRYQTHLQAMAAGDLRIRFLPPVPNEQILALLSHYHLLAVPSCGLETGPLVVLEAFAVGVPVLGANLGGIAELVSDGQDGLLVANSTPGAWATALARLAAQPELVACLRQGVRSPRTVADVAADMLTLYQQVASATPLPLTERDR
jgi:glycosyltransferase involved in cell wall biosynthesis